MWPESLEDIAERLAMINYWSWIMGTFLSEIIKIFACKSFSIYIKSS